MRLLLLLKDLLSFHLLGTSSIPRAPGRQVMRSGGQTDKRAMLQRTQASSGERDVLESRDLNPKLERDREKTRERREPEGRRDSSESEDKEAEIKRSPTAPDGEEPLQH